MTSTGVLRPSALAGAALLAGCASPSQRCGLVACGVDHEALLQVTAAQLAAPATRITIFDVRRYPGATVVWRARAERRDYQCREARDPTAPEHVAFVYCRPPS